jgi:Fic family protein
MLLARSESSPRRFYSLSTQICTERKKYYEILEKTQKNNLDITNWLEWFLECMNRSLQNAEMILYSVTKKSRFWEKHVGESFNTRQTKILNKLLDGFAGNMTSTRWATIGKCSQDTASRDINDLIKRKILKKNPGGSKNTNYSLSE